MRQGDDMSLLRRMILLQFAAQLALGQPAHQSKSPDLPNPSEAFVQSLYTEVVARHPHDIPEGEDMEVFAPYLSKALLHRIELAKACSDDWDRQNPEPKLKAEIASSYGLFSGEGVEAEPRAFQIEGAEPEEDGSSRVYVNLTWEKPPERPWKWRVAAIVSRENGHDVIDDVVYINDAVYDKAEAKPADKRLSEYLSAGCNGPHWSGYKLPNQPEALAKSLYRQAVARRPVGLLWGADWKAFAPYLSKTLLHRIDLALDCGDDWDRQDQKRMLMKDQLIEKPPLAWLELGVFSGGDEQDELRSFQVEKTESGKDGSFRVDVRLMWGWPPERPWNSRVAPVLVRESGRLVLDDVIYLKDEKDESSEDYRLSQFLSSGCDGPHWVGNQRNGQK
jgi:hypothetical protein